MKRKHLLKIISTIFFVMVSGVIVAKAINIPINFLGGVSGKEESTYSVSIEKEKIPMKEFSKEIQEERKVILQQLENYEPWNSISPNYIQREFSSQKDAIAYIGYQGLKELEMDIPEKSISVSLEGDSKGNIQYINMEVLFQKEDRNLQMLSKMYTEYADLSERSNSIVVEEGYCKYEEETKKIGENLWFIVTSIKEKDNTRIRKDAYMIKDKVEYNLSITYNSQKTNEAENLMKKCMKDW